MTAGQHVVVIGAGIVGASIAWHLVKAGARVTVVAGEHAGGIATPASFAWINASWGNPEPYFRLRTRSMREWNRVAAECAGIRLAWAGGLLWDLPRADLEAFAAEHASWGYGIRAVDGTEAARIEPGLSHPPEYALHVAEEGMVEPAEAARALLADAERRGARVIAGPTVTAIERSGGGVAMILGDQRIQAEAVVIAAGIGTPALAAGLGIPVPLDTPPGLIVHSKPFRKRLNGLVISPEMAVRQTADGRIIGSGEFGGTDPGSDPEGTARGLFAAMKSMLAGAGDLELEFHTVGHRPLPRDGFPIVGWGIDGVYVAVTHSGVTLAPAIGLFASTEILDGRRDALLAPYGPDRFGS